MTTLTHAACHGGMDSTIRGSTTISMALTDGTTLGTPVGMVVDGMILGTMAMRVGTAPGTTATMVGDGPIAMAGTAGTILTGAEV